jgi:uncharacterized repeat protein (TIGR03803 family)
MIAPYSKASPPDGNLKLWLAPRCAVGEGRAVMFGNKSSREPLTTLILVVLMLATVSGAHAADKYKKLYRFKKPGQPLSALTFDNEGNLYGTAIGGGSSGWGSVYELTPNSNGGWTEKDLYSFAKSSQNGSGPEGSLIFDALGNLYGTTFGGGTGCNGFGCGTVFELTPNGDGTWNEQVLYAFHGTDGEGPTAGLTFDSAGNLYGNTFFGGANGYGEVFELSPNGDGTWKEIALYAFNSRHGVGPYGNLVLDASGNVYGTTIAGGANIYGTVYELSPNAHGKWTHTILHSFQSTDGSGPQCGVVFDAAGNLYGTAWEGGAYGFGVVFRVSPGKGGTWTETVLHSFGKNTNDGQGPLAAVTLDNSGNIYGTTSAGGSLGDGTVFKLQPTGKGKWTETVLHFFKNHPGRFPGAAVVFDQQGNLYGTTEGDGQITFGSVFEITP